MINKKKYGQFYTTNSDYIISDLLEYYITNHCGFNDTFIDPCAGNWDLLNLLPQNYVKIGYDIDPKNDKTIKQDTLKTPPNYNGCHIITNPPWLAKNKNKDKTNNQIYELYKINDLYKALVLSICANEFNQKNNYVLGGILILPLNFFCDEQKSVLEWFLDRFVINKVKVFEEQVFKDTTYTCCAFYFFNKKLYETAITDQEILFEFWRDSKFNKETFVAGNDKPAESKTFILKKQYKYRIGDEWIELLNNSADINVEVGRLVTNDKAVNTLKLYAQDTGTQDGMIRLQVEHHIDNTANLTDRAFAGIKITKDGNELVLSKQQHELVCKLFNDKVNEFRKKYNSLNLTNYRNSTKQLARKRISFEAAYSVIKWALKEANIL